MNAEKRRLAEARRGKAWKRWGPYLAERQWGTVREDYSADGNAWEHFSHEQSRSRAYRWGEDGIGGLCDDRQRLCFSLALWNGRDRILKERLFGLTGPQGNHGEDVKELYYYLDGTPTHSYMKMLYKYPQLAFPYEELLAETARRDRTDPEFELLDTGIFDDRRYFDVFIEFAKARPDDVLIRVTAHNRGPEAAELHLLPQFVFRNEWSWSDDADTARPRLEKTGPRRIVARHPRVGRYTIDADGRPGLLFTENETNVVKLFGDDAARGRFKDAFHECLVDGRPEAVAHDGGTKAAFHHRVTLDPGESCSVRLRLSDRETARPFDRFDSMFASRIAETEEYWNEFQFGVDDEDARRVQRQALAGMLWTKQFYRYDVDRWLEGDPGAPPPDPARRLGRNRDWVHLANADILSMPDTWEYPWYAAWDLAFHCIPLALVDPDFAKQQLVVLTREWYMHPNGQLPAYEWNFSDVNPPVHAWATWRVYKIEKANNGGAGDLAFLERVFHKLLLYFTWWVNRKDEHGHNLFQGGFLGLDNIGIFDRSRPLPTGGHIEQADGTSWMAMFCLNMLRISLELAERNPVYQDLATKFFEHFLYIAGAMRNIGGEGVDLWDDEDQFFYDVLHLDARPGRTGHTIALRVRSIVGLIPLFAVETLEPDLLAKVPEFRRRMEWFLENRPDLASLISRWYEPGAGERRLLSLLRGHRMKCLLRRMLDPEEFLSEYGVRALSRYHLDHPYEFDVDGDTHVVRYQPAESDSGMFGGNSNWRGPIWFPINYLIIESLQKFHHYYGDEFRIECPAGSGTFVSIDEAACELTERLTRLFLRGADGRRALHGSNELLQRDPHFRDHLLFHEYFHGDDGRGLGASHQTGWTGLIAKLLRPRRPRSSDATP